MKKWGGRSDQSRQRGTNEGVNRISKKSPVEKKKKIVETLLGEGWGDRKSNYQGGKGKGPFWQRGGSLTTKKGGSPRVR